MNNPEQPNLNPLRELYDRGANDYQNRIIEAQLNAGAMDIQDARKWIESMKSKGMLPIGSSQPKTTILTTVFSQEQYEALEKILDLLATEEIKPGVALKLKRLIRSENEEDFNLALSIINSKTRCGLNNQ